MSDITIDLSPTALNLNNNQIKNALSIQCSNGIFSTSQPSFYASRTIDQTITTGVLTPVIYDNVIYNKLSCVSYNNVNGTITILQSGLYTIYTNSLWQSNTTGTRLTEINTSNIGRCAVSIAPSQSATPMYSTSSATIYFNANDTVQIRVLKSAVTSANITGSPLSHVTITRLS